ncbi:MAG: endonuclease III [Treponema sp.]|jgi:endonuclease-3|nr:endonuclease III [Treponema sp.]
MGKTKGTQPAKTKAAAKPVQQPALKKAAPEWDRIFNALQAWRAALRPAEDSGAAAKEPSVGTVAEHYKLDPWAILVSTIISLRTKDEVTLTASHALLAKAPSPAALLKLPEDETARLIYPAGFYRTKAANLKKIAAILIEQYAGRVPGDMEALLALPGAGRKTANLVLTEAFNKPGICVDTHVHRISNRTGWLSSRGPEETEMILREILPRKYWKPINALLVMYGQRICRPVSPFCSQCVISARCPRHGVDKSR